ncbi:hypothetical protein [Achromobacter sp. Marseille-Q4962]|uniref:hypothetical protein n=1 Tax=Achromobacter sp. Marseille-Q4962 TaxID=2942202 RepID=UPI002072CDF9|nr:hypothetical protein [Achromobacter sp. Marseille-Q4962]
MENQERELLLTLTETVHKLAEIIAHNHAQLEALRTVMVGVHGALCGEPELRARIEESLAASLEGSYAMVLGTSLSDDILTLREQWLSALIPADVWKRLRARTEA